MAVIIHTLQLLFQSTPSVWKATIHSSSHLTLTIYFNPRLPCGRRLLALSKKQTSKRFQSTPSVWKATGKPTRLCSSNFDFNPRLPCGRRQRAVRQANLKTYFNPRLPCGRRRRIIRLLWRVSLFQSTPSVWKATCRSCSFKLSGSISIHAFRVEGDSERHLRCHSNCISIHAFRVEGDSYVKLQNFKA